MPLTKKEQKSFEDMFWEIINIRPDARFIDKLADLVFDVTGNVNMRMRLFGIAQKLEKK